MSALLLQFGLMLLGAWGLGYAARRLQMPAIVGEILAGVLLGPTALGMLYPAVFHHVFVSSQQATVWRQLAVKIGLFLFLFLAGTEVTFDFLKQRLRATIWVSCFGFLLPFSLGMMAVMWQPAWWGRYSAVSTLQLALFFGAALSISALPVIARIFMDLRLMKTVAASIVMAAATCDDVIGWLIFSWILMLRRSAVPLAEFLPLMMFWVGVLAAKPLRYRPRVHRAFYACTMGIFAPLYFVSIGLRTNFLPQSDVVVLIGAVLLIAYVGKIGGVFIGAGISHMAWREACAVAFGMNARGAVGILLASLAWETHLIQEPLFVALVVMAIVTSVLAGPMIRAVLATAPKAP